MDEDLQSYIYDHIPIVKNNLFTIEVAQSPYIEVKGRFADHINHRNSVFGGSLSTALILCSWATVRQILITRGIENGVIVIQSQTVNFDKPVTGILRHASRRSTRIDCVDSSRCSGNSARPGSRWNPS